MRESTKVEEAEQITHIDAARCSSEHSVAFTRSAVVGVALDCRQLIAADALDDARVSFAAAGVDQEQHPRLDACRRDVRRFQYMRRTLITHAPKRMHPCREG